MFGHFTTLCMKGLNSCLRANILRKRNNNIISDSKLFTTFFFFFFFSSFFQMNLSSTCYQIRDLYQQEDLGNFTTSFKAMVNPTGVVMLQLTPVKGHVETDFISLRTKTEVENENHNGEKTVEEDDFFQYVQY